MAPVETVAPQAGPPSAVAPLLLAAPELDVEVEPEEELVADPLLVPPPVLDAAPDPPPLPLVELAGSLPDDPPPPELEPPLEVLLPDGLLPLSGDEVVDAHAETTATKTEAPSVWSRLRSERSMYA
jgi:hypothetical protein